MLRHLRTNEVAVQECGNLALRSLIVDQYGPRYHPWDGPGPEIPCTIPRLHELKFLCINYLFSGTSRVKRLIDGSTLPDLETLSLRGHFDNIRLCGDWKNLRTLNMVGNFHDFSWLHQLAPYLRHLAMSVVTGGQLWGKHYEDELLRIDFPSLEILEVHWCRFKKFPGPIHLPRLEFYSESRGTDETPTHDCLGRIRPHLKQLKFLGIRLMEDEEREIDTVIEELQKQSCLQACLIHGKVKSRIVPRPHIHIAPLNSLWYSLIKEDGHLQEEWNEPVSSYLQEEWNERLSLLRRLDPEKRLFESQGENYTTNGGPAFTNYAYFPVLSRYFMQGHEGARFVD